MTKLAMILTGIPALEAWCKRVTSGYAGVNIIDMTESWRSGLAFCAIIARFRPDLLDFDSLEDESVFTNCHLAFSIAEENLGIPALLDPRDMVERYQLDDLSIITYLAQFYHKFSEQAPVPAIRGSLYNADCIEKENVTKDSGLDDSSLSSRESSPSLVSFSENELVNLNYDRMNNRMLTKNSEHNTSHLEMRNKQTKLQFLNSLLSENHPSYGTSAHQAGQNTTGQEETPSKMNYCRSFESLLEKKQRKLEPFNRVFDKKGREDKASSFVSALKKFSSLSSSNINCTKTAKANPSNVQTRCSSSQTEESSSTNQSQGSQTEDVEDVCKTCWNDKNEPLVRGVDYRRISDKGYRDIYHTFYYQQGQMYVTLV